MKLLIAWITPFLACALTASSCYAEDPRQVPAPIEWIPATIGAAHVRVPLVPGLLVTTANHENSLHLSKGLSQENGETSERLRSIATTGRGLQLFTLTLMIDNACASGAALPLCRYAFVPSASKARVSWLSLTHHSDLAAAFSRLKLSESEKIAQVSAGALSLKVTLLQNVQGHPYGCPADGKFGHCRMYMKVGDNVLATMMVWRKENLSDLTPYKQIAETMGKTITQLMEN